MTLYRRGDVVLVPMDFTDRSGRKVRPAVVVSSGEYNRACPDVLIASITGNLSALAHIGDHRIEGWKSAGLLKPSLAQTKLATVEASSSGGSSESWKKAIWPRSPPGSGRRWPSKTRLPRPSPGRDETVLRERRRFGRRDLSIAICRGTDLLNSNVAPVNVSVPKHQTFGAS